MRPERRPPLMAPLARLPPKPPQPQPQKRRPLAGWRLVVAASAAVVLAAIAAGGWWTRSAHPVPAAARAPGAVPAAAIDVTTASPPATTTAATPAAASGAGTPTVSTAATASLTSTTPQISVAELLAGRSTDWRTARLRDNPAVLVIEFPGLAAQGSAMNRVAALLEKAGAPRDRVLADGELAALIAHGGDTAQTFYLGHDYNGESLLRFFLLAQHQHIALNADEQRLRRLLVADGLLLAVGNNGLQAPGTQAVITFTATQPDDPSTPTDEAVDERRRESVLLHESSHGRFYTRPAYREHCRHLWHDLLDEAQRERIRVFLASLGYDRRNEELMLNEAQAFLLHTPDTRAFSAAAVGMTDGELAAVRNTFWHSLPADGQTNR